ncbi:hypothetical protein [Francisella tularensis]|uniref:hypothetical protein n=1 Tax=Francisella tularensis TaxID=263 RepID=UPI0008F48D5D|nr:hypothetical protein [Francisella tularensis]
MRHTIDEGICEITDVKVENVIVKNTKIDDLDTFYKVIEIYKYFIKHPARYHKEWSTKFSKTRNQLSKDVEIFCFLNNRLDLLEVYKKINKSLHIKTRLYRKIPQRTKL